MRRWLWVAAACVLAGCMGPRPLHPGPDVVKVPEGFIYDPNLTAARNLFPERPKVLERGYTTAAIADEDQSLIQITEWGGPTTREETEQAVRTEFERYPHFDPGPVEALTIDGREAWGWIQTQPRGAPQATAMEYRAVVSYDQATYLVEFFTTHQRFLDPQRLKDVVASFVVND